MVTAEACRQLQVGATKSLFDELIDRHAEAYLAAYPDIKEFSNFERSGTINYYIGMVWTRDNEKPDLQQVRIRGSYSMTRNKMLDLDLSNVNEAQSFFPGQIVAFSADPFLKRQLTVRKFLDSMKIAPKLKRIDTQEKITLIVACGPFMKPEQDDWTLLDRTILAVRENQATHVVIIGPLVDIDNKLIRGQYDTNWRIVFDKLVEGLHDLACTVYLVPSTKDVLYSGLGANFFYPCSKLEFKLELKAAARPKCRIVSVTDPSQIDLGGVYLDVTSAEVLFHFNKCTAYLNKTGSPFTPIIRHIITHGIYPIYPSPTDIAIDYPKMRDHLQLDRLAPHIIVLPTRFSSSSVDNVENRLAVTIHKCSLKKHVMLVEIPRIESSEAEGGIDSVVVTDYTHRLIDLSDPVKVEPLADEPAPSLSGPEQPETIPEQPAEATSGA